MDKLAVWLEEKEAQMIEDIGALVGFESVADGRHVEECSGVMEQMAEFARRDGMEVVRHGDHCLSITMGSADKEIGIWNHLDVVPAEGEWIYTPFSLQRKDGFLIGRGVQDNKGPAIAVYYAMRWCKENKMLENIRVRQILGVREEVDMEDVRYYVRNCPVPDHSFVADCRFPVCCGEKGICRVELETIKASGQFIRLEGGTACNIVPEKAEAVLSLAGRETGIHGKGISGHAASPDNTVNAIGVLADRLLAEDLGEEERRAVIFLQEASSDGYGEGLGIACEDEISGRLTCNAGVLSLTEGRIGLVLDIRYPVTVRREQFMEKLQERAVQAGYSVKKVTDDPPYYREKNDAFVQTLMSAWEAETGQTEEAYVMGGGTYARHIPNAVAFGPSMSRDNSVLGLPEGHGNCHGVDEAESLYNLKAAVRIYVRALTKLDRWLAMRPAKRQAE